MPPPWKKWIPGALSKKQLLQLCNERWIGPRSEERCKLCEFDASSIDLHLTGEGYRLLQGSVKPFEGRYLLGLQKDNLAERLEPAGDGCFDLTPRSTYVFKLHEAILIPADLAEAGMYGQATAKSSIGRLDVLARLIVDGMDCYESFDREGLKKSNGDLYLEVTPITFPVKVKEGSSLSQLRIFYGDPEKLILHAPELYATMLHRDDSAHSANGELSVDLRADQSLGFSAFCASGKSGEERKAICCWKEEKGKHDPQKYWEPKTSKHLGDSLRLIVEKSNFYILRSKERIAVPPGIAVYCRASDETIGEMRIHYAGFAHPYFGYERKDGKTGTPLIFEVRGHDVNVNLRDDEKMARLICYRMSEPAEKDIDLKKDVDSKKDANESYNDQELELSNYFMKWPTKKE